MGLTGVQVAHAIPGRIRLKVAQVRGNTGLARAIETRLSATPGVQGVEANPVTGSVVVVFETGEMAVADSLRMLSATLSPEFGPLDVDRGEAKGNAFSLDREIAQRVGSLNDVLATASQGVDLRLLVPLTLGFLGLRSLLFSDKLAVPAWYDFFWFALSTYFMLHPGIAAEADPGSPGVVLA